MHLKQETLSPLSKGCPPACIKSGHRCRCTPGEWTLSAHETTDLTVTQLAREVVREKIFRYTQQVNFLAHQVACGGSVSAVA